MFQVYRCIREDHDPAILLVALLTCAFGALISLSIGRRAFLFEGQQRRRRLCLAGLGTGLTIWSTHFSIMLAYAPGVEVRFNAPIALASAILAVLMSVCAWHILSTEERSRGYLGGAMVGLALCAAHFLDMSALRVDGLVFYDAAPIVLAIAIAFPLCVAAGALLRCMRRGALMWAAGCLTAGTVTLHLLSMSAVRIVPTAATDFSPLDFDVSGLTLFVIASSAVVLLLGAGLALHDLEVARLSALDRERLKRSEEHHRFSVELNPQIPWIADAQGQLLELSPRWEEVIGYSVEHGVGAGWMDHVHPADLPNVLEKWNTAILTGRDDDADVRYRLRTANGSWRWFRARAGARRDETGQAIKWYGSLEDIHDQVCTELALRASEERYRLASLATNEVIWDAKFDSDQIEWSGAVEAVLGYPDAKFGTGRGWWIERLHPDEREATLDHINSVMHSDADFWTQEFRFCTKAGNYVDLLTRGHIVRGPTGTPLRMVGSLMDITARKRVDADLRRAAHHDPLTGLPNRKLFSLKLDSALKEAQRDGVSVGLLVIDVDHFKALNDSMGHSAGDAMLQEIATRLVRGVPDDATVARLGGDEFAIILPRFPEAEACSEIVAKMLQGMDEPFPYDGRQADVSLSGGAARFPRDGDDSEALLKSADLALYAAKAQGPGHVRGFEPEFREEAESQKRMLVDARRALTDQQIVPFYQPKICLRSGALIGFEALLRWHHQDRGLQPPAAILAAFDDPRLAPDLTDRMLARILSDMVAWQDKGCEFGRIAINGSREDFRRGDLTDRILGQLTQTGVPADRLELEVTETVFLGKHADDVETALRTLRREGVTIALDDFGTGYASLTHLKQFPVDVLKIDQSFISRMVSDKQQDAVIVGALIDLANNLGIHTVAEGVETKLQAFMLRRRGCDIGQGYYFSRPLPAAQVLSFIEGWDPDSFLRDADPAPISLKRG